MKSCLMSYNRHERGSQALMGRLTKVHYAADSARGWLKRALIIQLTHHSWIAAQKCEPVKIGQKALLLDRL